MLCCGYTLTDLPYPSGLLHWHCGNLTIAPVPAKQPWWIWINTSCEFIMNDCITTTKQSTTKPCAYFLGNTVVPIRKGFVMSTIHIWHCAIASWQTLPIQRAYFTTDRQMCSLRLQNCNPLTRNQGPISPMNFTVGKSANISDVQTCKIEAIKYTCFHKVWISCRKSSEKTTPGPLLLKLINFNLSMDSKYILLKCWKSVGWNYLSIPKLQPCSRWNYLSITKLQRTIIDDWNV